MTEISRPTPSDIERTREMLQEWGLSDRDYIRCYPEVVRFAEWAAVKVVAVLAAARQEERDICSRIVDGWLDANTMRLRAGEMTTQELQTAQIILLALLVLLMLGGLQITIHFESHP